MRYKEPEAFRTALEERLRQRSGGDARDLSRRRRTVAFDRLLARLAAAEPGGWMLKGGAALEFRMPDRVRTTRDVDLAPPETADPVGRFLDDVSTDPFGDWFSFRVTRRRELSEGPDRGPIVRLSLEASLGGRTFERFVVDVAVGVEVPATAERITLGRVLGFAEVPEVTLAVIDLRTHWAEKLSAYLRRYDDRPNTRVKDLVDLVLLIENGLAPDRRLRKAIETTFARREQSLPASTLPSMAADWSVPFAEMSTELGLDTTDAADAHASVEAFWRRARDADEPAAERDAEHDTNREPKKT